MTAASIPAITTHFADLAGGYDVVLSDVWGVVHNGLAAHAEACDALARFRKKGGQVVLITNAPRPGEAVIRQLDKLAVSREAYDDIVSSGDVTRAVILSRPGQNYFHLGPERDYSIFAGLNAKRVPLEDADYVVCSGLYNDEVETPDDYRAQLAEMRAHKLFMVCANPDVVVERGSELVYCAGALADIYAGMGGEVLYAGKPYQPIYQQALAKVKGPTPSHSRILAIGDSIRTDLRGAHAAGLDFLFVTAGIHADELGARDAPDSGALAEKFAAAGAAPKAIMHSLVW
jgi:HAD superfamily hydrolase (TIGR01459 family)